MVVKDDKSITKDGPFSDPEERQEIREAAAFVADIRPLLDPFVAVFKNWKALAFVAGATFGIIMWLRPDLITPLIAAWEAK